MKRFVGLSSLAVALALVTPHSLDAQSRRQVQAITASDRQQGAQAHPQLIEAFGGAYSGPQAAYVTQIGQRVAAQSGVAPTGQEFTVTLLDSPVNNAFAIPGGYIYITRQLLALMNDEAELAGVLGHEVGHVAARHSASRNQRSTIGGIASVLLGVVTGNAQIAQLAGQAAQLYTLRFSRSQEIESDDLGIRYMAAAGYDPRALASTLASLADQSTLDARLSGRDARSQPEWASTHPDPASRVRRAAQTAERYPPGGARNRDAFLRRLDGLRYGDDPRQGIVDGQTFLHPDLRLRFTVPNGFTMQNSSRAVSITGRGGQAEFSTLPYRGDLTAYVTSVFQTVGGQGQGAVPAVQPRRTRINGFDAAIASTRARGQSGQVDVTVVALVASATQAYHFVMLTPAGQGIGPFGSMIDSFNRLAPAEAVRIRGREIDVVTVGASDTPQTLARRMAFDDAQLERFLVLNGLTDSDRLTPGQLVKLVVYSR